MNRAATASYTSADLERLTHGAVDRKTAENWHNRGLWLTPSESPPRGRPRLYSVAHLFEALTRAALVEGGFTHAIARSAIESRLVLAAMEHEKSKGRRGNPDEPTYVFREEVAEAIYSLPELQQPKSDWYWAIYFACYETKTPELESTIAFKGNVPVADLFGSSRVASVLHISAVVRDVLAYSDRDEDT